MFKITAKTVLMLNIHPINKTCAHCAKSFNTEKWILKENIGLNSINSNSNSLKLVCSNIAYNNSYLERNCIKNLL